MQQGTVPESTRSPAPRDDERLAEVRRRVAAIKGFYIHLIVFVAVIVSLALLNAASGDPWWVQWVLLGWGIGVLAHALAVFGRGSKLVSEWGKRKIKGCWKRNEPARTRPHKGTPKRQWPLPLQHGHFIARV